MLRRTLIAGLTALSSLVPVVSQATEPTPFLATTDAGDGFELRLAISPDVAPSVLATVRFNRFAGRVVGADERAIGNFAVEREIQLVAIAGGGYQLAFGTAGLPDGVFACTVSVELVASQVGLAAHAQNRAVYFQIVNGVARRISLTSYSGLVDPTSVGLGKNGEQIAQHTGALLAAAAAPVGSAADAKLEAGDAFAVPGDERNER